MKIKAAHYTSDFDRDINHEDKIWEKTKNGYREYGAHHSHFRLITLIFSLMLKLTFDI